MAGPGTTQKSVQQDDRGGFHDQPALGADLTKAYFAGHEAVRVLAHQFTGLPEGTYVLIDIKSHQFVTADNLTNAINLFKEQFPDAEGFAHRIGD